MSNYFDKYDKKIFEQMNNRDWWIDKFKARKIELISSCRRINSTSSISRKIGGLLLWQQVIEQFLPRAGTLPPPAGPDQRGSPPHSSPGGHGFRPFPARCPP